MLQRNATEEPTDAEKASARDLRRTNYALLPFLAAGVFIILVGYISAGLSSLAIALMWAASCLICGVAIGFLFGIPRVADPSKEKPRADGNGADASTPDKANTPQPDMGGGLQVNTNLIEVSDWLTKIIVGLGLVNLTKIPSWLDSAARVLAAGLASGPDCRKTVACTHYAFASGLILAFAILGFLMGYLYTRLFLAGAFKRADDSSRGANNLIRQVDKQVEKEFLQKTDQEGRQVSSTDVARAERVRDSNEEQAGAPASAALRQLAKNYESLRLALPAGNERTREMTKILVKMRALALAALNDLPELTRSASPGERLAAVAILQMKPDTDYLEWLIARITVEKPFVGFAAVEALRRAADQFTSDPERSILRNLLSNWIATPAGAAFLSKENDRVDLLRMVLSSLDISVRDAPVG